MANYSIEAELKANVSKYRKAIQAAKRVTEKFKRESESVEDTEVDADTRPLQRNLKKARATLNAFAKDKTKAEMEIDADTSEAKRKMGLLQKMKTSLNDKVVIPIEARVDKFHRSMDRIANTIQSVGTVAGNAFKGGLISVLPALSPIIASLTAALGGLTTSFAAAGTGAVAFGSVATSALNDVFTANGDIKKLREQLANTSDLEERAEITKQIKQATAGLSKEQQKGLKSLQSFSKFWSKFAKQFEKPVMDIFVRSLNGLKKLLKQLEPAFQGAVKAVDTLSKSLSKSMKTKEFKEFISFLNANVGPAMIALGKTFGNVMQGIMNLMVAFGPLSTDMQGGLVSLTKKFSDWTAGLKDSKAFHDFIDYVKENGPKVIALIGNITAFLIELGKGMAPLGSKILDIVNAFLEFTTALMDNHPAIGQVVAVVLSLSGVLMALIPFILLTKAAFGGMATGIWKATGMMRAKVVTGVKMMIASLKNFVVQTFKTVANFIAGSAKFIARWTMMGVKALFNAGRMALAWTIATGKKMVVAIAKMIANSIIFIARWTLMGAKAIFNAGRIALAWTIATGKKMAIALAKMIATSIKFIARWALMAVKSLFHAARMAASWFIALGPVGWVIATIIGLVALVIANWDKVKKWTIKTWNKISSWIVKKVSKIWSYIQDKFPAIAYVIKQYTTMAWNIIKSIWTFIKSFFSSVLKFIKALVKGDFQGMKSAISNITRAISTLIKSIWNSIKSFFSSILGKIVNKVKNKFKDMFDAVMDVGDNIKEGIEDTWDGIKSFFDNFSLYESGKKIISSLGDGLIAMKDKVVGITEDIVGAVRDFFPFSPAKTGPLRDIHRMDFAGPIGQSIKRAKKPIQRKTAKLAEVANNSIRPDMQIRRSQITSSLRSIRHRSVAQVQTAVNTDVNLNTKQPAYINVRIGRTKFTEFVEDITVEQNRNFNIENSFRR